MSEVDVTATEPDLFTHENPPLSVLYAEDIITLESILFQAPLRTLPLSVLGISVYLAEITSQFAQRILERKNTNRPQRLSQLQRITRALEQERWVINGETIIFDQDGRLIEGQHRLQACVNTGITFWALIVHGIDKERFKTMGQGAKRTVGDILGIQGVRNSRTIGAALRWVYRYETEQMMNPHPNITDDELADTLPQHPKIIDSLAFGAKSHSLAAPALVTALHYLCTKRSLGDANDFFWKFATGEQLEANDVILVLRDRFLKTLTKRTRLRMLDEQKAPMIVLAWNLIRKEGFVKLKDSKRLSWHGRIGQKFPKIL